METGLVSVSHWCAVNKVSVKSRNTQIIVFRTCGANVVYPNFVLGGISPSVASDVKLLGALLDGRLVGSAHAKELTSWLAKTTFAVRYLKNLLGSASCSFFRNVFGLPLLFYGAEL